MNFKKIYAGFMLLAMTTGMKADEGMWLMNQFQETIYPKMKKLGLAMKPGEIYDESKVSLSDAIVALDGGSCSGSIISQQGLLITNHHCAYGDVNALSTEQKNYLEDGFWAGNFSEEIPIEGKTVQFLRKIINVTDEAHAELDKMKNFKGMKGRRLSRIMETRYKDKYGMEASLGSMWKGTQYYIFLYDEYKDIRLVAAPPVSIGAFGGEQDNWQWPQHKGDFAMYRVYTAPDGKSAEYSKDNVPLKPRRVLEISSKGVKNGDFSMILGYPGRTARYVSSFDVAEKQDIVNPIVCDLRRTKLEVWKKHMNVDPAIRLKYADRYFMTSNVTDYARWENKCFYRYDVENIRAQEDKELDEWLHADASRMEKYGDVIGQLRALHEMRKDLLREKIYYREGWATICELLNAGRRLSSLASDMKKRKIEKVAPTDSILIKYLIRQDNLFYNHVDLDTDQETLSALMGAFLRNVPSKYYGKALNQICEKFQNNPQRIAQYIFDNSILGSRERLHQFFSVPRSADEFTEDVALTVAESCKMNVFNDREDAIEKSLGATQYELATAYTRALYAMRDSKHIPQYPDANSTMRLSFGTVGGLTPSDAIHYDSQTTIQGYLDKVDQSDYEFRVDSTMLDLIHRKDFGRWASKKGTLPVNFLTNQDITGGNSGSPVLNAKGQLVGLAFDGNRESMAGDAYFHPELAKTVCVDIRFVLWIIDKYAKADYLLKEMNIK